MKVLSQHYVPYLIGPDDYTYDFLRFYQHYYSDLVIITDSSIEAVERCRNILEPLGKKIIPILNVNFGLNLTITDNSSEVYKNLPDTVNDAKHVIIGLQDWNFTHYLIDNKRYFPKIIVGYCFGEIGGGAWIMKMLQRAIPPLSDIMAFIQHGYISVQEAQFLAKLTSEVKTVYGLTECVGDTRDFLNQNKTFSISSMGYWVLFKNKEELWEDYPYGTKENFMKSHFLDMNIGDKSNPSIQYPYTYYQEYLKTAEFWSGSGMREGCMRGNVQKLIDFGYKRVIFIPPIKSSINNYYEAGLVRKAEVTPEDIANVIFADLGVFQNRCEI